MVTRKGIARRYDVALLEAFLEGCTIAEVAERAEVSKATVNRRLKDPEFLVVLRAAQQELVATLRRRTAAAASKVLDALLEIAQDDEQPAAARVAACKEILDRADPVSKQYDVAVSVMSEYAAAGVDKAVIVRDAIEATAK